MARRRKSNPTVRSPRGLRRYGRSGRWQASTNSGLRLDAKVLSQQQAGLEPSGGALVYEEALPKTEKSAGVFSGAASSFLAASESPASVGASFVLSEASGTFVGTPVSATSISPSSPSRVR